MCKPNFCQKVCEKAHFTNFFSMIANSIIAKITKLICRIYKNIWKVKGRNVRDDLQKFPSKDRILINNYYSVKLSAIFTFIFLRKKIDWKINKDVIK